MEFVFAGLFMISSSIIFKKTRDLSGDKTRLASGLELYGTLGLGAFLLLIGIYGLASGIYVINFGFKEASVLFALAFSVNIQARLLNYASQNEENGKKLNCEKSNGIKVLKTAFSIGLFPKQGSSVFFIHACQIVQLGAIALFVFS
jgi:hypothetical protein